MIVVLEGQEGAGKTTCADWLSRNTQMDLIRPFRKIPGYELDHTDKDSKNANLQALRDLGLIVNTFLEDIVVAEVLSITQAHAVLDRSLPSSLVYGIEFDGLDPKRARPLFNIWQECLVRATRTRPVYVHYDISYAVARERSTRDPFPYNEREFKAVSKGLSKMFSWATEFIRIRVNADKGYVDPERLCDRIKQLIIHPTKETVRM